MLAIVLHPASRAAAVAFWPPDGMNAGLSGDDLLLQTGQELFAVSQGQAQAGQVSEVTGPRDPQNIGAVLRPISPKAYQSHNPGHVVSTSTENRPKHAASRFRTPNLETVPRYTQSHSEIAELFRCVCPFQKPCRS